MSTASNPVPPSRTFARAYAGGTEAEALGRFEAELPSLQRAGFRPVAKQWQEAGAARVLAVRYRYVSLAPRSADGSALPLDDRMASLARILDGLYARGWSVEWRSDVQAIVRRGEGLGITSHAKYLVLTILTIGVWLMFWLGALLLTRRTWRFLSIDEAGVTRGWVYRRGRPISVSARPVSSNEVLPLGGGQDLWIHPKTIQVHIGTTLLVDLESDQVPRISIARVDPLIKDPWSFSVSLTGKPEPGSVLTWFILN